MDHSLSLPPLHPIPPHSRHHIAASARPGYRISDNENIINIWITFKKMERVSISRQAYEQALEEAIQLDQPTMAAQVSLDDIYNLDDDIIWPN